MHLPKTPCNSLEKKISESHCYVTLKISRFNQDRIAFNDFDMQNV